MFLKGDFAGMDEQVIDCLEGLLKEYIENGQKLLILDEGQGVPEVLYPANRLFMYPTGSTRTTFSIARINSSTYERKTNGERPVIVMQSVLLFIS